MASVLPLACAKPAGLRSSTGFRTKTAPTEVAEVDTALLTDDLPPAAYADSGFIQYFSRPPPHRVRMRTGGNVRMTIAPELPPLSGISLQ